MSSINNSKFTCAVCGSKNEYGVIMSTNTFGGSMDLDTRPPGIKRSTMYLWVQECPNCGYVSAEVSDKTAVASDYLKTEEYMTCNGLDIKSDLAKKFYKHYMISMKTGKTKEAFYASLYAAWASDDTEDIETANICRKQCVELISEMKDTSMGQTFLVMKADLLRRMGSFDDVISEYDDMYIEDELLQKIIEFEVAKSKEKDLSVYKVDDIYK